MTNKNIMIEHIDTNRTIKEIFENMFKQFPSAKHNVYMYMHSDKKYDYFKDKLTKEYIRAIK